ncbi:MAG: hypothetical protein ABI882_04860, partial [Acidobacteriota bacterium]
MRRTPEETSSRRLEACHAKRTIEVSRIDSRHYALLYGSPGDGVIIVEIQQVPQIPIQILKN